MERKPKSQKARQLRRSPEVFRRLVGIPSEQFFALCEKIIPLYEQAEEKRLHRLQPKRIRALKVDKQYKLSLEDRLLMLLMYYRLYVTHAFLGFLLGIDDSNVGRNMNPLQPLLAKFFKIPERKVELGEDEIALLFLDGTEQKINRPQGHTQKKWYSGKKKGHTIKHQVIVNKNGRIKAVGKSAYGKTHDKKDYESGKFIIPMKVPKKADLGYVGTSWQTPIKKPRKRSLSEEEKQCNRAHSKERIRIEHVFGKMKIFKILADRFRNKRKDHMLIFKNIAGIHNMVFA